MADAPVGDTDAVPEFERRGPAWHNLPAEIVRFLGEGLATQEWASARSTCKHWRDNITANIEVLDVDLERESHRWIMVMGCVKRIFPQLHSIVLLVGSRVSQQLFKERMLELSILMNIQDLELRFMPITDPRIGEVLSDPVHVTCLCQLRVLKVSGPTPSPACLQGLSALRRLVELEVLPGDYGCLGHEEAAGMPDQGESPTDYGLTDEHMVALSGLSSLTSLTTKVKPSEFSPEGLAALASLSHLAALLLFDSELPSTALRQLRELTRLTALQVGVRDTQDLGALHSMTSIKELYLDAAALPDLRCFTAGLAAGLTAAAGPGALTGLYLVDQMLPGPEHMEGLGQLRALKELVLENPRVPLGPAGAASTPVRLPLTCLSSLRQLELLQIDRIDCMECQPCLDVAGVQLLTSAWTCLSNLDIFNLWPGELPTAALAELSRLGSLRSLSVNSNELPDAQVRCLPWWKLPSRLVSLHLSHFDLTGQEEQQQQQQPGSAPVAAAGGGGQAQLSPGACSALPAASESLKVIDAPDGMSLSTHFSCLQSLRLQDCLLPAGFLPVIMPPLKGQLVSLTLWDVGGTQEAELQQLSALTALTVLRLQPNDHALDGLEMLLPLRQLKNLKVKLAALQRKDLVTLSQLTSLFTLTLAAPCTPDRRILRGFPSAVSEEEVLAVLRELPYADLELSPEPMLAFT